MASRKPDQLVYTKVAVVCSESLAPLMAVDGMDSLISRSGFWPDTFHLRFPRYLTVAIAVIAPLPPLASCSWG